jgi:hypothetical protein
MNSTVISAIGEGVFNYSLGRKMEWYSNYTFAFCGGPFKLLLKICI